MTEHIKTGYDIEDEMRRGGDSYDKEGQKKWVSLPWLQEKINDLFLEKSTSNIFNGYNKALYDILALLEEKHVEGKKKTN